LPEVTIGSKVRTVLEIPYFTLLTNRIEAVLRDNLFFDIQRVFTLSIEDNGKEV